MVRETLGDDEAKLLSQVPESGSKGNHWLQKRLGWDAPRYFEIRNRLVEQKLLTVGGGRGGSVRRAQPGSEATDEAKLLSQVPEDGTGVGNNALRERLGWDAEQYFTVRNRLVERKVLALGRGRGGSVYRIKPIPSAQAPEGVTAAKRRYRREADLYTPVSEALKKGLERALRRTNFLVQVTGKQGRRATGGMWTRPDVTVVSVDTYAYVPGKFLEVVTYEIKPDGVWDISGVFEAASHSRFATKTFLLIHAPKGLNEIKKEQVERLQAECTRFGIGLGYFQDPESYDTYDFPVEPSRRVPDPEEMDRFISQQLSDANKKRIVEWLR